MWIIYKHTNKINCHAYIGITSKTIEKRSGKNGSHYLIKDKDGLYLHKKFAPAIEKYGWDNFDHEVLETVETLEEAKEKEIYYISLYNSKEDGYNCTIGGDSIMDPDMREKAKASWHANPENEEKTRQQMIEFRKQPGFVENMMAHNWTTQEQFDKAAERMRERNADPEYQKKCREGFLKNPENLEHQLTALKEYYENRTEEEKQAVLQKQLDSWYANPENSKQASERITKFKQDPEFEANRKKRAKEATSKKVICLTTGIVYDSMGDAERATGADRFKISMCCSGKRKHSGKLPDGTKLSWAFYIEEQEQIINTEE